MEIVSNKLRLSDRLLGCDEEPPLAAHLVTPRIGFAHHGIYVGAGRVVHYGRVGYYLPGGPVEEVSLVEFTRGRGVWVRPHERSRFECTEVIRRARSRVGEDCYRVLSNNCEHFCEWCIEDEQRSYQVDSLLAAPRSVARKLGALATRLTPSQPQRIPEG
jgi:hypothetical protein